MQAAAWSGVTLSVFIGAPQPLAAKGHALTLTCAGKAHQMDGQGPFQPRETFALSISGRKAPRVSIGPIGSRKSAKARILDDNPIQLKFATSKFTGSISASPATWFLSTDAGNYRNCDANRRMRDDGKR